MPIPICVVDAFAGAPFAGNPAAVCILETPGDPGWMQSVASEMNLSETSFLVPRGDGGWELRWFTPTLEVALCGHATLAAAHALWTAGKAPVDQPIRFHTRSGWLVCTPSAEGIRMDFPARPVDPADAPAGLAEALGADLRWCGRAADDLFVELAHAATLRALAPDFAALGRFPARGIVVTTASDLPRYDFLSRFFAPASGIAEDPVTGSAHCALAPYWGRRLGKTRMLGFQASRRGGEVGVDWKDDRVELAGSAVTVWRGEWVGSRA